MAAKNEGVKGLRPGWVRELLRSSFLPLFIRVRGRRVLRSSPRQSSRKLANARAHYLWEATSSSSASRMGV